MLQITKGECQFLFDLLREVREGPDNPYERELDEGIEILDEILKRWEQEDE